MCFLEHKEVELIGFANQETLLTDGSLLREGAGIMFRNPGSTSCGCGASSKPRASPGSGTRYLKGGLGYRAQYRITLP